MQQRKTWNEIKSEINQSVEATVERCAHERTDFRRYQIANGALTLRRQCVNCGELVGSALKRDSVPNFDALPMVDEVARQRASERWRESGNRYAERREEIDRAFWEYYQDYITSNEWRAKRDRVLRRANGVCEGCGLHRPEHVHHQTYQNLGAEFLFELVAICRDCHQRIHPHREIA